MLARNKYSGDCKATELMFCKDTKEQITVQVHNGS